MCVKMIIIFSIFAEEKSQKDIVVTTSKSSKQLLRGALLIRNVPKLWGECKKSIKDHGLDFYIIWVIYR